MNETDLHPVEFEKRADDAVLLCRVEPCEDGSVYVCGDEIEMVFEFAPDCLARALQHVQSLGYVRTTKGSP
jgi:hypothetical protein